MSAASYPVIGIRPLIDGRRRGVRESLEDKTVQLAKDVAGSISSYLIYPDGSLMRRVVSETVISGTTEANRCEEQSHTKDVCADLTVTASWNYTTEVLDLDPFIPHAIWGLNDTECPGAVTLAAAVAAYNMLGISCFDIYGHDVQDADDSGLTDDVVKNVLRYVRAALGAGLMRGCSYLSIRTASMRIAGCRVPEQFFVDYLGMRAECTDMIEIDRRIAHGIYDHQEYETVLAWAWEYLTIGENRSPGVNHFIQEEYDEQFDYRIKMLLIGRDLMEGNPTLAELGFAEEAEGHDAIAAGFQGQRQRTDYKPNGDILEIFLNTILDWNDKRPEKVSVAEGGAGNAVVMLFSSVLTHHPQLLSDVRAYWSPEAVERVTGHKLEGRAENGFIDLRNSGAITLNATGEEKDTEGNPIIRHWWEIIEVDIEAGLKVPTPHAATRGYFPGGGLFTHFTIASGMPVTATRLNFVAGQGPALQTSESQTVELPDDVRDQIVNRTDPTWPTAFFVPRPTGQGTFTPVYDWMTNWGANHTATGYGYFDADLITLTSILRIPVYMHNVERERVLRLKAWAPFGTAEPESADFRACATFGPLYR